MRRSATALAFATLLCAACEPLQSNPVTGYLDTIPVFWNQVYAEGGQTLYCGERFGSDRHPQTNIEHVFPMSWVVRELGCADREQCRRSTPLFNRIEADMHNLYPSLRRFNRLRGARPYGDIRGEARRFGDCDFELAQRPGRVEPRQAVRGDIARAMLYMADRYQLPVFKKQLALLKRWHQADPPDSEERRRNARIEQLQGERNPFIDEPALASRVKASR